MDVEANAYRSRIWLASADASPAPLPFTAGEYGAVSLEWHDQDAVDLLDDADDPG